MTPERFTELLKTAAENGKWYVELFDSQLVFRGKFTHIKVTSTGVWRACSKGGGFFNLDPLCEAPRTLHDELVEIAGLGGDLNLACFIRNHAEFLKTKVMPDA